MAAVRLDRVTKDYAEARGGGPRTAGADGPRSAVRDLTLDVRDGELLAVLGPSGCGKTTTLRIVAGFETPTKGEILFDGERVTHLGPEKRRVGMVFQNYALFPHLDVFDNVAFGLKLRKLDRGAITRRVSEALETVGLRGYGARPVQAISGGEQQRVALARAIVTEPRILLLDEPLSNLDARLREEMRRSLRELQRRLRVTTIFVTHDQREALSLADRVAVMRQGELLECEAPETLYSKPRTSFVARFVSDAHVIAARATAVLADGFAARLGDGSIVPVRDGLPAPREGDDVLLAVPPDALRMLAPDSTDASRSLGTFEVARREFFGPTVEYRVRRGGTEWRVRAPFPGETLFEENETVALAALPDRLFRVAGEKPG